jgi:hypothetical protein
MKSYPSVRMWIVFLAMIIATPMPAAADNAASSNYAEGYAAISQAEARAGNLEGARADAHLALGKLLMAASYSSFVAEEVAAALARVGDLDGALRAIANDPIGRNQVSSLGTVALALAEDGDRENVTKVVDLVAEKISALDPGNADTPPVELVWALARTGDVEAATALALQLDLREDPKAPHWQYVTNRTDALSLVAYEQARSGDLTAALVTAGRIAAADIAIVDDLHAAALSLISHALAEGGDFARALAVASDIPVSAQRQGPILYRLPLRMALRRYQLGDLLGGAEFWSSAAQPPRAAALSYIAWKQAQASDAESARKTVADAIKLIGPATTLDSLEMPFAVAAATLAAIGDGARAVKLANQAPYEETRLMQQAFIVHGYVVGHDRAAALRTARGLAQNAAAMNDRHLRDGAMSVAAIALALAGDIEGATAAARNHSDKQAIDTKLLLIVQTLASLGNIDGAWQVAVAAFGAPE